MFTPIRSTNVYHGHHLALLDVVRSSEKHCVDSLIVDTPFGADTTDKHNALAKRKNVVAETDGFREVDFGSPGQSSWDEVDVEVFVREWSPSVAGWFVVMTDDRLAPVWRDMLDAAGRCTFVPIPYVAPGSRFRQSGDGPSCWTVLVVVARPRGRKWQGGWTQPGAYVKPPGSGRAVIAGGKDLWIMQRLVNDYSRPGDLVCDPCCGAGTTLVAGLRHGRKVIGGDRFGRHAEMAALWCENYDKDTPPNLDPLPEDGKQALLFDGKTE